MTAVPQITAPERSLRQRLDALENANRIRTYRAGLKRDLKAGRRSLVDVLEFRGVDRERLETAKVYDVLLATPKIGRVKANTILNRARISPSKTLGGMTERQRGELIGLVGRPGRTIITTTTIVERTTHHA